MKVTRRRFTSGAAASGLFAALGPAIAQAPQKLSVRVDFLPWGMHAGLHLAVEKGWFQDAGLEVDVSDGKGSDLGDAAGRGRRDRSRLGAARRHGVGPRQGHADHLDRGLRPQGRSRRSRAEGLRASGR